MNPFFSFLLVLMLINAVESRQGGTLPLFDLPKPMAAIHHQDVPFASQAPFGDWDDPRQQDGCEEASALMAMHWVKGRSLSLQQALDEILAISLYEEQHYGTAKDTSAHGTMERIFQGYFGFNDVEVVADISIFDMQKALLADSILVVPVDGRILQNPFYTPPGPDRHMIVIVGYDPVKDQFITNDPGTKHGKDYRYPAVIMQKALSDYPSGNGVPQIEHRTAMIVIKRPAAE